ncbi:MAG: amidohydrolase family protein [Anaerolineae bacterium]|nr:amidohydrolase family protein [Thermoflexales bacterium]HQW35610.1 amidohydrolase family protein [Thermoflexales bacterium]
MKITIPGLIDPHVHMRVPGGEHKEDFDSGTCAALAGGYTTILAMPNTKPPVMNAETLDLALGMAARQARCDYGQYVGAGEINAAEAAACGLRAAGLKIYLDATFGDLKIQNAEAWMDHFERFPRERPIVVHAEQTSVPAIIQIAQLFDRSVHIAHVSRREEILVIRKAKERGLKVTCEVGPHHLFLCDEDAPRLGPGRCEVRPRLQTRRDQEALWANLEYVDCFATDHAPHLLSEKDGPNPPPGFPGLETALAVLMLAVHDGRLTMEDIIARMHTNPQRIFGLPDQPNTFVEVDTDAEWVIRGGKQFTRCAWSPFDGLAVRGKVTRVVLRGADAFCEGVVLAAPGNGQNVRSE